MYDGGRKVTADEIIEKENECENFGRWQSALFDRLARRSREEETVRRQELHCSRATVRLSSFRRSDLATTSERIF